MKPNVDPSEIKKFEALAHRWWDPNSEFRPLHQINPLRINYIESLIKLDGKHILDVGCGGGILAEGLATKGAHVTGIDMADKGLSVAKLHLHESKLDIKYEKASAEDFAVQHKSMFDVVTCMEMLEHVPDPEAIVTACAQLVRPGGDVVFSTINRNPKAFALAIFAAEQILRLIPPGTHDYAKLIRPSELCDWARAAGLKIEEMRGLRYNPLLKTGRMTRDVSVNYFLHARRPR